MCSTGAAIKLTVLPAITPAMAWPIVGSFSLALSVTCSARLATDDDRGRSEGLEKTFSSRIRR